MDFLFFKNLLLQFITFITPRIFRSYVFFKYLFVVLISFILPIKGILITVGLAILGDTVLGLIKAYKLKIPIISRKLSKVVSKMVLYEAAIILFFMIDKFLLSDFIGMFSSTEYITTKIVALTLLSIEVMSMNENYQAITGVSIFKQFKNLLVRAKDIKEVYEDIKDTKAKD